VTVTFVEPTTSASPEHVDALVMLHQRWFPDYGYAIDEIRDNASGVNGRDDRIVHQVLVFVDDVPAGFILIHSNLLRRVGLIHFIAVEQEFRSLSHDGQRLSAALVSHGVSLVAADLARAGDSPTNGVVAETEEAMIPVWERLGFAVLPFPYAEPHFGVQWAAHGEPTFFDRTLVGTPIDSGPYDFEAAGKAGASAFLLDHYLLPSDHPAVAMLRQP
jgi:hypothetical protein